MTDSDIGQLTSTQEWVKERGMSESWSSQQENVRDIRALQAPATIITSWDDEDANIRREQEQDARDMMSETHCTECGTAFLTTEPDDPDAICGTCWRELANG